jgi:hypothetical protein
MIASAPREQAPAPAAELTTQRSPLGNRNSSHIWRAATVALLVGTIPLLLISMVSIFWSDGPTTFAVATLLTVIVIAALAALVVLADALLRRVPGPYKAAVLVALSVIMTGLFLLPVAAPAVLAVLVAWSALVSVPVAILSSAGWHATSRTRRVMLVAAIVAGLVLAGGFAAWTVSDGWPTEPPPDVAALSASAVAPITLGDPSQRGSYTIRTLTYGSGRDQRRAEFGQRSRPRDAYR